MTSAMKGLEDDERHRHGDVDVDTLDVDVDTFDVDSLCHVNGRVPLRVPSK